MTWWKSKPLLKPWLIGSGSFGKVYGPYDSSEIELFLSKTHGQKVIHPVKKRQKYIIKIISRYKPCDKKRSIDNGMIFTKFQKYGKMRWIVPLNVGMINRQNLIRVFGNDAAQRKYEYLYEIQEYGGHNLFDVMKDQNIPWTPSMILTIWNSIKEILAIGTRMIENGYLMSDIKMDNMVIDFDRGIFVIDPEIYRQNNLIYNELPIVTPDPSNLPVQFINNFFFSKANKKKLLQLYTERWSCFHENINKIRLPELIHKTESTLKRIPHKKESIQEYIEYMASLSLFYPFMMIMVMLLKKLPRVLITSEKILTNMDIFCHWVIKDRVRVSPRNLLKWMDLVTKRRDIVDAIKKNKFASVSQSSPSLPLLTNEKRMKYVIQEDYIQPIL